MKNGAFAPKEQTLHFHNIFKYMIFQRRQKALLWSKGLNVKLLIADVNYCRLPHRDFFVLRGQNLAHSKWNLGDFFPFLIKIPNLQNFFFFFFGR